MMQPVAVVGVAVAVAVAVGVGVKVAVGVWVGVYVGVGVGGMRKPKLTNMFSPGSSVKATESGVVSW